MTGEHRRTYYEEHKNAIGWWVAGGGAALLLAITRNIGTALLLGVLISVYFLPAEIAYRRHVKAPAQVLIVDLFLGWTLIGWVVALVMAFRDPAPVK